MSLHQLLVTERESFCPKILLQFEHAEFRQSQRRSLGIRIIAEDPFTGIGEIGEMFDLNIATGEPFAQTNSPIGHFFDNNLTNSDPARESRDGPCSLLAW